MEAAVERYVAADRESADHEGVDSEVRKRQRADPLPCPKKEITEETLALGLDLPLLSTRQLELMERMSGLLSSRHPSLSSLRKKKKIRALDYFRQWGFL
jgi:hypothetical protein